MFNSGRCFEARKIFEDRMRQALFEESFEGLSHRVKYDYASPSWYYITICTHNRECLFGDVRNGKMVLNAFGKLAEFTWYDLPNHNTNVDLDQFVVMPNQCSRNYYFE
jgi:poly(A) polymerase Pap1